jgi:hypothetical protein
MDTFSVYLLLHQFLYSQLSCNSLNELTLNERTGIQCLPGSGQRTTTGIVSAEIAASAMASSHGGGTSLPTNDDDMTEKDKSSVNQWRALIRTHNNWYDFNTPIDFNGNGILEDCKILFNFLSTSSP